MKTKLTLSIEETIIEKGRKLAKAQHSSLSAYIEQLLEQVANNEEKKKLSTISQLHGMFGETPESIDWKELTKDAVKQKHG